MKWFRSSEKKESEDYEKKYLARYKQLKPKQKNGTSKNKKDVEIELDEKNQDIEVKTRKKEPESLSTKFESAKQEYNITIKNLMNTKKELKNIKVDIQKSNSEYADIISKIKLTREELLKANNELQEKTKADNSPDVKRMKEEREKLENEIRQKRKDLESGFRELKFIKDEMTKSSKGEGTEKIVDAASAVVASMNQKLQTTLTELNAVKKTLENERKQRKNST